MRVISIFILTVLISCQPETEYAEYGEKINNSDLTAYHDIKPQLASGDSAQIKLEGEILGTCKMKGCWMNVKVADGEEMRVTFKKYGFFVPKEGVEGRNTILEGTLFRQTTDVATLKHFAQDQGKSQEEIDMITEPKDELTFVATGVLIEEVDQ